MSRRDWDASNGSEHVPRHIDRIDQPRELTLTHDDRPILGGEHRRPSPVWVMNGHDLVIDPAGPQSHDVKAVEADPHRHRPIPTEAQANGRRRGC
jgi:hypothetical protein